MGLVNLFVFACSLVIDKSKGHGVLQFSGRVYKGDESEFADECIRQFSGV